MITLDAAPAMDLIPASGAATIMRAHYYDAALHRAITQTGALDGPGILERAAAGSAYRAVLASGTGSTAVEALRSIIGQTGLGDVERIGEDDGEIEVVLSSSPYAIARQEMFGAASVATCDITRGIIAGVLAAVSGLKYGVEEVSCEGAGGNRCHFLAVPADGALEISEIPGFVWPTPGSASAEDPSLDVGELLKGLLGAAAGVPGATYGRLWADLYTQASHDFEEAVPRTMGSKFSNLPSVVLSEAAHLGTFYSIGGLLRSVQWQESVATRVPARTDWVHVIVALINSFGWGDWRVCLLAPEQRFTVHVHDGYEALSSVALAGLSTQPRCYFARGVVAALMNVLYGGDAISAPALNQSVYNGLFRSPLSFRAIETRCQAMGDPYCEFVANPLSPGLRRG